MSKIIKKNDILLFWFEETSPICWFKKDPSFDTLVRNKFENSVRKALNGKYDHWANDSPGCLALILLLDQFTRNIFRDTPHAFSGDEIALGLSLRCIERKYISHSDENWRRFMLMPMMHSEDLNIQNASLPLFEAHTSKETYSYAIAHRDIIAKFGRFPHRNNILGRPSSIEEQLFLKQPGSKF